MDNLKLNIESSGSGEKRDLLSQCDYYIAIITPNFISNPNCIGEMKDAQALGKKMYALVDKKTELTKEFMKCSWILILKYGNDFEYEKNCIYLKELLEFEL